MIHHNYSIYTIIDLNTEKLTNVSKKGYNMAGAPSWYTLIRGISCYYCSQADFIKFHLTKRVIISGKHLEELMGL